jgi:hypothetical protein
MGIALAAGRGGVARVHAADTVFRIAYQKGAVNLVLVKERGTIEEALKPQGWSVTWPSSRPARSFWSRAATRRGVWRARRIDPREMHELLIGIWQTHRFTIILIIHDVTKPVSLACSSNALARAGYVAAAVNHPGNNVRHLPASFVRTPRAR